MFLHHEVLRFQVSVDNALIVRVLDRKRRVSDESDQETPVGLPEACERPALYELHRDERLAILVADFVDGRDIGVSKRRGELRLPPETSNLVGVVPFQEFE